LPEVRKDHYREVSRRVCGELLILVKISNSPHTGSPLAGKLFDQDGECLYVARAAKGERRYRYYVSRGLIAGSAEKVGNGWRLSAPEIERTVAVVAQRLLDGQAAACVWRTAAFIRNLTIRHTQVRFRHAGLF